jgi:hypothetical protein
MEHSLTTILLQRSEGRSKPRKSPSPWLRLLEIMQNPFTSFYFHLSNVPSSIDRERIYGRDIRREEAAYAKDPSIEQARWSEILDVCSF